jgi:hypothetical protein
MYHVKISDVSTIINTLTYNIVLTSADVYTILFVQYVLTRVYTYISMSPYVCHYILYNKIVYTSVIL